MANRTINSTRVIDPTGPNQEEGMDLSKGISVKAPDPVYYDKDFVRSLARDRTEMAAAPTRKKLNDGAKEVDEASGQFQPITYSKESLDAASAAVPHMQRGTAAQTISPAMERTLRQAQDYIRRKMDKISTPMLRAISNNGEAGYQNEDIVTGERFYLTVDEVKRELARRDALALKLAEEMFVAYAESAKWTGINGDKLKPFSELPDVIQKHWKAAAEYVIEKYRCLL